MSCPFAIRPRTKRTMSSCNVQSVNLEISPTSRGVCTRQTSCNVLTYWGRGLVTQPVQSLGWQRVAPSRRLVTYRPSGVGNASNNPDGPLATLAPVARSLPRGSGPGFRVCSASAVSEPACWPPDTPASNNTSGVRDSGNQAQTAAYNADTCNG